MSNTSGNNNKHQDNLNDDDISALFAADEQQSPAELDSQILSYAKSAQTETITHKRETFFQRYTPLISTAAVVALAIAITPLLMNAPQLAQDQDSYADASAVDAEELGATASNEQSKPESVASSLEQDRREIEGVVSESDNIEIASSEPTSSKKAIRTDSSRSLTSVPQTDSQVAQSNSFNAGVSSTAEPVVDPQASADNSTEQSSTKQSAAEQSAAEQSAAEQGTAPIAENMADSAVGNEVANIAAGKSEQDNNSPIFRLNPKRWITEINRLFNEDKLTQARQELKLFREKHPDHPNEALLSEELQRTNTDESD